MPRTPKRRGRLIKDVTPEEIRMACDRRVNDEPPDWQDARSLGYLRWVPLAQEEALRRYLHHAVFRIISPDGSPMMVRSRRSDRVLLAGPLGSLDTVTEMAKIVFDRAALYDVMECVGVTEVCRYCADFGAMLRIDLGPARAYRYERIVS